MEHVLSKLPISLRKEWGHELVLFRRSTGLLEFQKWLGERIMGERLAAPQLSLRQPQSSPKNDTNPRRRQASPGPPLKLINASSAKAVTTLNPTNSSKACHQKREPPMSRSICFFSCLTQAIAKKIVGRKRHVRLTNAKESIILSCMVLHLLFHQRKPLSLHPPEQLSSKFPASRQEAL